MAVYTSFDALLASIQAEMMKAMKASEQRSFEKALENAEDFYSQGDPEYYVRTGKYGDSPDSTGVMGTGDYLGADIYMNPSGHGYRTGSFSAQEVWDAAENGTYGVLGKPGRWKQTESDIGKIVQEEFGKRFK